MPAPKPTARAQLNLNRTIFFVAMSFLYGGLLSGAIADVTIGDPYIVGTDILAFFVFSLTLFLGLRGIIPYGIAILICLVQTSFNFIFGSYLISLFHPSRPLVGYADPQFLLLFGVFGAVAGIGISRWAAVIFGFFGLITIVFFSFGMQNSWYYQHWFGLDMVIVVGCMIIVFYYRTVLENLVDRLDKNLIEVSMLKDKAEELHELDKPFVMFGQNTAGLVQDFQNDVVVLGNELEMLRKNPDFNATGAHLVLMTEAVRNLNRRIEWVKYVASATPQREEELLHIGQLVESAVYPFKVHAEYRTSVLFTIDITAELAIRGYRRWLLQVIENLIRSACGFGAKTVKISARPHGETIEGEFLLDLVISDDGFNYQERLQGKEIASAVLAAEHMNAQLDIKSEPKTGIIASIALYNACFVDLN